jgi:hypothetical protein
MTFVIFVIFRDTLPKNPRNTGARADMDKPEHRSRSNLPTVKKIKKLAEYRGLYRKQKDKLPTWTSACNRIGIGYKTVRWHAPELFKRGNEEDFHF